MTRRLALVFAKHPSLSVLAVLAMFTGMGMVDGIRIARVRDALDEADWALALAAGLVLAPLTLVVLRVAVLLEIGDRPKGGEKTVVAGIFGWLLLNQAPSNIRVTWQEAPFTLAELGAGTSAAVRASRSPDWRGSPARVGPACSSRPSTRR